MLEVEFELQKCFKYIRHHMKMNLRQKKKKKKLQCLKFYVGPETRIV